MGVVIRVLSEEEAQKMLPEDSPQPVSSTRSQSARQSSQRISATVPTELYERLKETADKSGLSISRIVSNSLLVSLPDPDEG